MVIRDFNKSTPVEIRDKFDHEVHKYSDIDKGQVSAMDSALIMDQVSRMAAAACPKAKNLLDIGCGAGNYTLKILQRLPGINCTLVDLSQNMLDMATERVGMARSGIVNAIQGDIRDIDLGNECFDIVIAATSLHHLRAESEWEQVFANVYQSLTTQGAFFISDLVLYDHHGIDQEAWEDYWAYLDKAGGDELKQWVFEHINKEDSPRSLNFQVDLMKKTGFAHTEIFYRRSVFAAFCGVK